MKAYKGFDKDLKCRGFQFEEGKTYKEKKAELCECGFHACLNPLDVLQFYPIFNSVYHEVELVSVQRKSLTRANSQFTEDTKICGKQITIGKEISVLDLCEEAELFILDYIEKHKNYYKLENRNVGEWNNYNIHNRGDIVYNDLIICLEDSGKKLDHARIDTAYLTSPANCVKILNMRNWTNISASGNNVQIINKASCSISVSGSNNIIYNTDFKTRIASSGIRTTIINGMDASNTNISVSGEMSNILDYGNRSNISCSANDCCIEVFGKNSNVVCSGKDCIVSGSIGTFITLTGRDKDNRLIVTSFKIDGNDYKENTPYIFEDGSIVEYKKINGE